MGTLIVWAAGVAAFLFFLNLMMPRRSEPSVTVHNTIHIENKGGGPGGRFEKEDTDWSTDYTSEPEKIYTIKNKRRW